MAQLRPQAYEIAVTLELAWLVGGGETDSSHSGHDPANNWLSPHDLPAPLARVKLLKVAVELANGPSPPMISSTSQIEKR
jgi:hypothetical protein